MCCACCAAPEKVDTMNIKTLEQAKTLVKASYINQGQQALNGRRKMVGPAMYHTASSQNKRIATFITVYYL